MIFKIWFFIQGMLIILKVTGMLNISWFWIVIPTLFPMAVCCLFLGLILLVVFIDMFRYK